MAEKATYEELKQRVQELGKEVLELKQTESYFGSLLESLREDLFVIDPNYRIIDINNSTSVTSGLKREWIIGRRCYEISHGVDQPCHRLGHECKLREVFETGEPSHCCHAHQHADGSQRFVDILYSPIKDPEGNTTRVIESLRDITELIKTQQSLQKSERKYRMLFEKMMSGFALLEVICDDKGRPVDLRFLDVNRAFEPLTGIAASDVIGKTAREVWLHTGTYWINTLGKVALTGEPVRIENYASERGRYYQVVVYSPVEGQCACIFQDITERKLTHEELQWELRVNSALAALSAELIAAGHDINKIANLILKYGKELTDSDHGVVSTIDPETGANVSHTLTEMLDTDCAIRNPGIVFPIGPDGKYNTLTDYTLNTHEPFFSNSPENHPASKGTAEGHIPIGKFLSVPIMFENELVGQIALANPGRDYTDKDIYVMKQIGELYALALNRQRSDEDKKRLMNQLQQAQKMEAIGTLAGGIAHDFNNILGVIIGCTELSQHKVLEEDPVHSYLNHVLTAADRAKNLTRQILAFSRPSEQKPKPLLIGIIVKEALKMLRSSLPSTIQIHQDIQADTGMVMADPTQIHQLVMNLSTNAAHAMGEKGGLLKVNLEKVIDEQTAKKNPDLKSGAYAKLTISDTGHGMDHKIMKKIFDPYFTTKAQGEGTGLGLAVVHGILKSHGGTVDVHSEPGQGTTFNILFPRIDMPESKPETENPPALPTGNERILFVDDEESLVLIGQNMLQPLGYKVVGQTGSIETLKTFRAHGDEFSLVIMDQTMPDMTGIKLAQELMRIRPDIPIILCTGYSRFVTPEIAKAKGIRKLLMKPYSEHDLAITVRNVLDE